jgi:outer membrane lipoprotein
MHGRLLALMLPGLLFLSACPTPPPPLAGTFPETTVEQAQQKDLTGQRVRWGGTIVTVTPGENDTCFEIVSRPLDAQARPRRTDETSGRFLACAPGFYDPAIYGVGRNVTVVGTLQASVVRKIGEHEYHYPQVSAEEVYLWPERVPAYTYYAPWPDPFWYPGWWGPYGPYAPWFFYEPFWGVWSPPPVYSAPGPPPQGAPHPGGPHPKPEG